MEKARKQWHHFKACLQLLWAGRMESFATERKYRTWKTQDNNRKICCCVFPLHLRRWCILKVWCALHTVASCRGEACLSAEVRCGWLVCELLIYTLICFQKLGWFTAKTVQSIPPVHPLHCLSLPGECLSSISLYISISESGKGRGKVTRAMMESKWVKNSKHVLSALLKLIILIYSLFYFPLTILVCP